MRTRAGFEQLHRDEREPWSFSERAIEILRHEWVARTVASFEPRTVLDVGCSLGQLTDRLARLPFNLIAVDVSPTAVARARSRITGACSFASASVTELPVASRSVDLVVASDGLYSWDLDANDRHAALRELRRVLEPSGHVVFTEHTRRERFAGFVSEIEASGLRPVSVTYLHDRPWYQFESWFRAVQPWRVSRAMRRSLVVARGLQAIGRAIGPRASRHICVVATP